MWDVVRFAEHHRYAAIVVENVVDAARWILWPAWRTSLDALGYCVHAVYLNSMHAQAAGLPAPQSRDRLYLVAHQRHNACPDLDRWTRPQAWCETCSQTVRAVQAWKNPTKAWGRYRSQYVWRCPHVTCRNAVVEPGWLPAAAAIDWTLPGERIGDRTRSLAPKTLERIAAGLARYATPRDDLVSEVVSGSLLVPVEGRDGKAPASTAEPLRTMTTRNETALVVPLRNNNTAKPAGEPFDTFAAAGNHHGLLVPYYGHATTRATTEPHGTLTTRDRYALVMRNNGSRGSGAEMCTPVGEPLRAVTTAGHQSVLEYREPVVEECLFRMLEPHEVAAGMAFFPRYVVLGNKREQVRQLGNAVTPPAARDLIAAVVTSLGHHLDLPAGVPDRDRAGSGVAA
jgi:DNA (cytosine-5)-methyltransferase 1